MKKTIGAVLTTGALLLWAPAAWASGIDGRTPLVCDLAEAAQCDGVAACEDVTAVQIDLPPVVLVDFEARQLASEAGDRTSPILSVEEQGDVLMLQGHQNGRGWTMVVDRTTGHLSAALVDVAGAFVLAGACAPADSR